jgi:hypothetical protein
MHKEMSVFSVYLSHDKGQNQHLFKSGSLNTYNNNNKKAVNHKLLLIHHVNKLRVCLYPETIKQT